MKSEALASKRTESTKFGKGLCDYQVCGTPKGADGSIRIWLDPNFVDRSSHPACASSSAAIAVIRPTSGAQSGRLEST